ncbi:hypothetical protein AAFF_G00224110 [Aldrovandia affinis]|uniref:Uncharacterized protein n=1 Tax=Aldrovandia affinis TaxID=143900 RepID=A0AAD7X2B1_9TELE|nr:hypothetical protein AAFF_G00224110 [Aldrovandia affinis]
MRAETPICYRVFQKVRRTPYAAATQAAETGLKGSAETTGSSAAKHKRGRRQTRAAEKPGMFRYVIA